MLFDEPPKFRRNIVGGDDSQKLTIEAMDERAFSGAQSDRIFSESLKNWLQLKRGSPNHLQQLARRRLLFQRVGKLPGARLHLLEQPSVLNRDHGLVGEGAQELDLSLREVPFFKPAQRDRTNGSTVFEHRYSHRAAEMCDPGSLAQPILGVRVNIRNLRNGFGGNRSGGGTTTSRLNRRLCRIGFLSLRRHPMRGRGMGGCNMNKLPVEAEYIADGGPAE